MLNFPLASSLLSFSVFPHFTWSSSSVAPWSVDNYTGGRNGVAVSPDVPSSLGLWNGAYLHTCTFGTDFFFLHELTLKCFPGSFRVFLAWLSVSMQAGVYINAHMLFFHSTVPLSLPLSLSFPLLSGPTYLYPPLLSICGDCRVFSVDCHIHHLPLDIDVLVNVYFGPGR